VIFRRTITVPWDDVELIVLVVGVVLVLVGSTGRAVGGRRHWY
jgi:Family of unknown function (DUF6131)